jgi:hypothetical protein
MSVNQNTHVRNLKELKEMVPESLHEWIEQSCKLIKKNRKLQLTYILLRPNNIVNLTFGISLHKDLIVTFEEGQHTCKTTLCNYYLDQKSLTNLVTEL